ncbi:MAG: hypothetical protein U0175_04440 [Caldilineaceae bacterium]
MTRYHPVFSLLFILCLLFSALPAQGAALEQQPEETLRQCSDVSEEKLLDELNTVSQQVFADALTKIDVSGIVETQWNELAVDNVIDRSIDEAVTAVKNDTDLWTKFLSSWSSDQAKELATTVTNKAFESEAFRSKLDQLSVAVAAAIGTKVGELSAESVSAAFYCLQTFIGGNYADVLVASFEERVQNAVGQSGGVQNQDLNPGVLAVLDQHKVALGGIGVIIAAQITRRLLIDLGETIAERVAGNIVTRILGRVGSELVPIAGWIIGTGLIVYDVYNSRDGALPQIQEELKSPEVKTGIRSEVVASIEPELNLQLPEMARSIANDLFSRWRDTKRDIRQVVDLSASNPQFKSILERVETQEQLAKLVNMTGAIMNAQGRAALDSAIADGSLERALSLPSSAPQLMAAVGSLPDAIAWGEVSGELLDQVVALEIYKAKKPSDVDRTMLEKLVAVDDKAAVSNLVLLDKETLNSILTLSSENLKAIASKLTPDQLTWLAQSLPNLSQDQRNQLVARLVSDPGAIAQLQNVNLLSQVGTNDNIDQLLSFISGPTDVAAWAGDSVRLLTGQVALSLFIAKFGWGWTAGTGAAVLLLALILIRLIISIGSWLLSPFLGGRR